MNNVFTFVVLHADDSRDDQCEMLVKSLSNIKMDGAKAKLVFLIEGEEEKYKDVLHFPIMGKSPFASLKKLFEAHPELPEDVIIFSDDMFIANPCPISVLMLPRINVNSDEVGKSSHCPIYAKKSIFVTDLNADFSAYNSTALELLVNRLMKIEPAFRFPVDWKVGPMMGNFVSPNPSKDIVLSLFMSRYFIHASKESFAAIKDEMQECIKDANLYWLEFEENREADANNNPAPINNPLVVDDDSPATPAETTDESK